MNLKALAAFAVTIAGLGGLLGAPSIALVPVAATQTRAAADADLTSNILFVNGAGETCSATIVGTSVVMTAACTPSEPMRQNWGFS